MRKLVISILSSSLVLLSTSASSPSLFTSTLYVPEPRPIDVTEQYKITNYHHFATDAERLILNLMARDRLFAYELLRAMEEGKQRQRVAEKADNTAAKRIQRRVGPAVWSPVAMGLRTSKQEKKEPRDTNSRTVSQE